MRRVTARWIAVVCAAVAVGALLCVSLAPARTAAGTFTFAPASPAGVGASPRALAVGDLNGDGRLDLVVANSADDTVSVLLGNGDGTVQPQRAYASGLAPSAVAVADVNGDGRLDLVVANSGDDTVSVLLGNGDGTFQPPQTYATGPAPSAVAVADVDGDHKPDVVVADAADNTVSVLLGDGDGTFQPPQAYATGAAPSAVAVADVNGDGTPDVVVADAADSTVSVLLGNGDGSFQPQQAYATGQGPSAVAVADVNGDGTPDVVVADAADSTVSVLLGNGDGTFAPHVDYAAGAAPDAVALADLNADGTPDVVVANAADSTVSVLLGNGGGTFAPPDDLAAGRTPTALALADFNRDGKPDIAVADAGDDAASLLLNTSVADVSTTPLPAFGAQTYGIAGPAQHLTLANDGSAPLSIASVVASTGFSASGCGGLTLPAGGSCSVGVTFTPQSYGPVNGTLTIATDAPASPTVIPLSGTGLPPQPLAVTLPATSIDGSHATLNGLVVSQGPGTFQFEYGPSTAYDDGSPTPPLSSRLGPQPLSATIPVAPGTTYHYRIVATNLAGKAAGADQVFSTPPDPPRVTSAVGHRHLRAVLRGGLPLLVSDTSPATVRITVSAGTRTARAAPSGVAPVVVGSVQVRVTGAGTSAIHVRFGVAARRALGRLRRLALTVDASAVSTAGVPGAGTEIGIRLRRGTARGAVRAAAPA
jgi:FG-GAP-like repeat